MRWVVHGGKRKEETVEKHTEDLIWFSEGKCEVVLLHQLAILLGAFPAHLGGGGGFQCRGESPRGRGAMLLLLLLGV